MVHDRFFKEAGAVATKALCNRARCGSVIVSNKGEIIGSGYNAPPLEDEDQRMCSYNNFKFSKKPKSDKTCCVHAEWNAIINALKHHPNEINGSTLYFMRIDENDNFTKAGEPYCTVCSRLAMQSGILKFGLWNNDPEMFEVGNYNIKSYNFHL